MGIPRSAIAQDGVPNGNLPSGAVKTKSPGRRGGTKPKRTTAPKRGKRTRY